jgi:hypothetical protein
MNISGVERRVREAMDNDRYRIDKIRPRPPYTPKNIKCASCGAGLTQKDEHSELIVCNYCGSHLDVSGTEEKILSKGQAAPIAFPLAVGDSFHYKSTRFEIIARMGFIEEGEYDDPTRQYLLYNPRMGTMWLDEYNGQYSISTDTHVMPNGDAFSKHRGDSLSTYDGRKWVAEGRGTYALVFVDGALPWIARVGDTIDYAEFAVADGSGDQYEVQKIAGEIEYGTGKALPLSVVRSATRKPDLGQDGSPGARPRRRTDARLPADAAVTRRRYRYAMLLAAAFLLINAGLMLYCMRAGRPVLYQGVGAQELSDGLLSQPFTIRKPDSTIKITATSSPRLDNEWMFIDYRLVRSDEKMIHDFTQSIEYYHGYEGGERWSEGGQSRSVYLKIPETGTYRLFLEGVSARGNARAADKSTHGASLRIKEGVKKPTYFIASTIGSGIVLAIILSSYTMWKKGDEDEED